MSPAFLHYPQVAKGQTVPQGLVRAANRRLDTYPPAPAVVALHFRKSLRSVNGAARDRERVLQAVCKFIGDDALVAWNRRRLVGFFESVRSPGRAALTVHTYASIVHRFPRWCVEAELLQADPLAGFTVRLLKAVPRVPIQNYLRAMARRGKPGAASNSTRSAPDRSTEAHVSGKRRKSSRNVGTLRNGRVFRDAGLPSRNVCGDPSGYTATSSDDFNFGRPVANAVAVATVASRLHAR